MKITKRNSYTLRPGTIIFAEPYRKIVTPYNESRHSYDVEELDDDGEGNLVGTGRVTELQRSEIGGREMQA